MNYTEIITAFMSLIGVIVVAVLGYLQNKKAKEDKAYRELRDQLEAEKAEKAELEKKEQEKRLQSIENSVKELHTDVDALKESVETLTKEHMKEIMNQLSNLHIMQSNNFAYIHSLSNVVINIGENMIDYSLMDLEEKQKLEEVLNSHKKTESDIHSQLYKLIL